MKDEIYKAIQVRTPKDNPDHNGLFDTNHGKVLFRDGKWLFDKNDMAQYDKELFWHKRISKKEYLEQFKKEVCKKQREICADKARTESIDLPNKDYLIYDVDKYSILNAPEPE